MNNTIFEDVVSSLLETSIKANKSKLLDFKIKYKNKLSNLSEDKQRNLAVKYYQFLLQERATEISDTWLFQNL